jgi:serine/threonine protein kinase
MDGQPFGRYQLLDKVAAGGMAEVWRARISGEANFQRIIAIKKILPHVAEDEDFIAMFTDEALITSSLQHGNIGQVYEFNRVEDTFFIAMEYISGKDLKGVWSWCRHRKSLMPIPLAVFITQKIADGLDYAHSRRDSNGDIASVIHRDVSPQNVLLSWEGDVKLIDFGIAKATEKSGNTRPGTLKGKFAYMSPEQIRGLPLDGRADMFALGIILYELVTGERGFQAESEFSLLEMVRNVEIRPPAMLNENLPPELERIIYKALSKDRNERYPTCADFSEDLQRFALTMGKPANARDLAAYVRANFTVDWEREKARLESYRDAGVESSKPRALAGSATPVLGAPGVGKRTAVDVEEDPFQAPTRAEISAGAAARMSREPPHSNPNNNNPNGQHKRNIQESNTNLRRPETRAEAAVVAPPTVKAAASTPQKSMGVVWAALLVGVLGAGAVAAWLWMPSKRTVVVSVEGPARASVTLDQQQYTASPSVTITDVATGAHALIVEAPGFLSYSGTLEVTQQPITNVTAPLQRASTRVKVVSTPAGASLLVDGVAVAGTTPLVVPLPVGVRSTLTAQLPGHRDVRTEVQPTSNPDQRVDMLLAPLTTKVRIVSVPEGAQLTIGDKNLGTLPVVVERNADDPYPSATFTHKGCTALTTKVTYDRAMAEATFTAELSCR